MDHQVGKREAARNILGIEARSPLEQIVDLGLGAASAVNLERRLKLADCVRRQAHALVEFTELDANLDPVGIDPQHLLRDRDGLGLESGLREFA